MVEEAKKSMSGRLENSLKMDKYQKILAEYAKSPRKLDENFRKLFSSSYGISTARKTEEWKNNFFEVFESCTSKSTFEEILKSLSEKSHIQNCEASFASKILATINPEKPILDSKILKYLGLQTGGNNKKERLENALKAYNQIEKWYEEYLKSEEAKSCIQYFDELFPKYKNISSVKKIDFFIWGK